MLHTRSIAADNLKLWVWSQSHRLEWLYATNSGRKAMDSKLCVVTWVSATRGSIRFRENFIVNTSIYFVDLLFCGLFRLNPSQVFYLEIGQFHWFSWVIISLVFFTILLYVIWLLLFNLDHIIKLSNNLVN